MTNPAEFFLEDVVHRKMFGRSLLNVENVWMAVGAVEPLDMSFVGEKCRRDGQGPF
jgi:hypothetical protein